MICPQCQRENRPEAAFCDGCGARQSAASDSSVASLGNSIEGSGPAQSEMGAAPNRSAPRIAEDLFVGRHAEMEELRAALRGTISGRGRLAMLVGEPGAGKTRTCEQLAGQAIRDGAQVLWGRCYENPGAPPYWPWLQIIRAHLRQTEADAVRKALGAGGADVAEIVPELREWLPEIEPSAALEDPDQARFRLFDSITNFLKTTAEEQPLVLFLDNLHWADKPSLLLLEFLASEIGSSRMLVVGTYRDIELSRQHPLSETLAELTRQRLFLRVELRGLSKEEIGAFIENSTGASPISDLVEAIHTRTEGNPLFLSEVVRLLSEEGAFLRASTRPHHPMNISIPTGVKEVIGKRLNRLSDTCTQTLTMASVIGREFGVTELESLVDHLSEERLLEALDEAVATKVIEEIPQAVDRYQFSHVLIRETLYEELTSSRRARLHRRIGETMEDLHASNVEPYLAQLAYHFSEARHNGSGGKVADYAKRAGDQDLALLAYEEASRHYGIALQGLTTDDEATPGLRCELLLSLGEAQTKEGSHSLAMETFQQAFAVSREAGSPEDLARAAVGFEDARWRPGLFGGPAVRLLREALQALGDENPILQAKTMAALVRALYFSGLRDEAQELSRQAMDVARQSGDQAAVAHALSLTITYNRGPEKLEERLAGSMEVLDLAARSGDADAMMDGYSSYIADLLETGDAPALQTALETFGEQAEKRRQPFYAYMLQSFLAMLDIAQGRFEEAERKAKEALSIGQRLRGQDHSGVFGMKMFSLCKEQGRLQEVLPAVKLFLQNYSADSAWRPGLASIYSDLGMEPEARSEFELLAKDDFANLPQDALMVLCLVYLAEVCAFLQDTDRARILYQRLLPWDGQNVVVPGGVAYCGAASRYLGLLATVLSDWDSAERHFQTAVRMDTEMGAKTWLTHTQHDYAKMLLTRKGSGDREKAGPLIEQALSACRELGMRSLEERVDSLSQSLGSTPGKGPVYPDGLTPREVEVLKIVATGKTDREVAEKLFISVGTVNTHVKSILNKTGSSNRTEATAYAVQRGLV